MKVVVVGAGLAGLAATCRLVEQGCDVVLIERSRLIGGKATSFTVDGVEVDNGQHVHLGCCTEYLDFVSSLGMAGSLWTQSRFEVTVLRRHGRPSRLHASPGLPPALSLLPSFMAYAPLGPVAKLQVARALRRVAERPRAGETFAGWLGRHGQGRAAIAGFWELFVVPALNARLDEVSAADALFVVRTAFAGTPAAARIGWSRVPLARIAEAAAARAVEVRLRTGVVSLLDDGRRVHGVRCSDGEEVAADAVVLAVPPPGSPPSSGSRPGSAWPVSSASAHARSSTRTSGSTPRSTWASQRSSARRCSGSSRSNPATSAAASARPTPWCAGRRPTWLSCAAPSWTQSGRECVVPAWCAAPPPATRRQPSSRSRACIVPARRRRATTSPSQGRGRRLAGRRPWNPPCAAVVLPTDALGTTTPPLVRQLETVRG